MTERLPPERFRVAIGIAAVALAAIVIWLWARSGNADADSSAMTACAQLYRDAGTLADTIRVDGQTPVQGGNSEHDSVTCGVLRASYPYKVVPIP